MAYSVLFVIVMALVTIVFLVFVYFMASEKAAIEREKQMREIAMINLQKIHPENNEDLKEQIQAIQELVNCLYFKE